MNTKNCFAMAGMLLAAACTIPPKDPFVAAERAVRRNDLLRALRAYDAVPVAHPRYPDARAAAGDIEQSMRRCHELILEALMLRGQWRDEEALEALRRAGDHWPSQPSLPQWIAATEQRLRLFEGRTDAATSAAGENVPAAVPLFEVASDGERQSAARQELGNEVAIEIPSTSVPEPMLPGPARSRPTGSGQVAGSEGEPSRSSVEVLQLRANGRRVGAGSAGQQAPGLEEPLAKSPASSGDSGAPDPMVGASGSGLRASSANPEPPAAASDEPVSDSGGASRVGAGQAIGQAKGQGSGRGGSGHAGSGHAGSGGARASGRASGARRNTVRPNARGEDPVALGLVAVEVRLGRGELPAAVRDLIELARRFPEDIRVNRRLGRLLHQRALMHYGQGAVAAAIADWRRVLALEPDNESVQRLLARAVAESERR